MWIRQPSKLEVQKYRINRPHELPTVLHITGMTSSSEQGLESQKINWIHRKKINSKISTIRKCERLRVSKSSRECGRVSTLGLGLVHSEIEHRSYFTRSLLVWFSLLICLSIQMLVCLYKRSLYLLCVVFHVFRLSRSGLRGCWWSLTTVSGQCNNMCIHSLVDLGSSQMINTTWQYSKTESKTACCYYLFYLQF